ncbi:unnamed protein product, partial [Laminaria digitata]
AAAVGGRPRPRGRPGGVPLRVPGNGEDHTRRFVREHHARSREAARLSAGQGRGVRVVRVLPLPRPRTASHHGGSGRHAPTAHGLTQINPIVPAGEKGELPNMR